MLTDPNRLLLQLARALEEADACYAIGGSVASSRHGEIRATHDIDVLVELDLRGARDFLAALGEDFHVDADAMEGAVRSGGTFTAIHLTELAKIDFFVATDEKLHRLQLAHREPVVLAASGPSVYFVSAEDMILVKLAWFDRSQRVLERQLRDVAGILKTRGDELDLTYLRDAAAILGLTDLLESALEDSGLGGPG